MKKTLLFCLVISFILIADVNTNAQTWAWVKQAWNLRAYPYGENQAEATAADKFGNVYVAGVYSDTASFSHDTVRANFYNMYLAKYDSSGKLLWVNTPSVSQRKYNSNMGLTTDAAGNIFMTGEFEDTLAWGGHTVIANSNYNLFIAKFNPSGNTVWIDESVPRVKGYSEGYSVVADGTGNIYVAGDFKDTMTLGAYTFTALNYNNFVAKLDTSGGIIWVRQSVLSGSLASAYSNSITIDNSNGIYITGNAQQSVTFGANTLTGGDYTFIVKYDNSGNVLWAAQSDTGISTGYSVATDNKGSVYVTGSSIDSIVNFGNDTLRIPGAGGMFLVKYSSNGKEIWCKSLYETTSNGFAWYGKSLSIDAFNNIYIGALTFVTGSNNGHSIAVYGRDTFAISTVGNYPAIVLKIDTSGSLQCGTIIGNEVAYSVAADPFGEGAYVVGTITDSTFFNPYILDSTAAGWNSSIGKWHGCDNVTGIAEVTKNNLDVKVYPNPSTGIFNFEAPSNSPIRVEYFTTEVYNTLGQKVQSLITHSSSFIVDLTGQPTGIYFYRTLAKDGSQLASGKLVVE